MGLLSADSEGHLRWGTTPIQIAASIGMPMISRMQQRRVVRDQLVRADRTTRHQSGVFKESPYRVRPAAAGQTPPAVLVSSEGLWRYTGLGRESGGSRRHLHFVTCPTISSSMLHGMFEHPFGSVTSVPASHSTWWSVACRYSGLAGGWPAGERPHQPPAGGAALRLMVRRACCRSRIGSPLPVRRHRSPDVSVKVIVTSSALTGFFGLSCNRIPSVM